MKNILILSASPRKLGNSDLLCDAFMNGAIQVGHQVEKLYVCDQSIAYCIGCGVCQKNTNMCTTRRYEKDSR